MADNDKGKDEGFWRSPEESNDAEDIEDDIPEAHRGDSGGGSASEELREEKAEEELSQLKAKKRARIIKYSIAIIFAIAAPIAGVITGFIDISLSTNPWSWVGPILLGLSVGLIVYGVEKHNSTLDIIGFIMLGVFLFSFTDIVGLTASGLEKVGVDSTTLREVGGQGSIFKTIKCTLTTNVECLQNLNQDAEQSAEQVSVEDIKLEDHSLSPSEVFAGQNSLLSFSLQNEAGVTTPYSIRVNYTTEGVDYTKSSFQDEGTCNEEPGSVLCEGMILSPFGTKRGSFTFSTSQTSEGVKDFETEAIYKYNIDTTLPFTVQKDTPTSRSRVGSQASDGAANFILYVGSQPLQENDPLTLSGIIKNNDPSGTLIDPVSIIKIPKDVVEKPNPNKECFASVKDYEFREFTGGQVSSDYDNIETCPDGYSCFRMDITGEQRIEKSDEISFACQFDMKELETERKSTVILGDLYYEYSRSAEAELTIRNPGLEEEEESGGTGNFIRGWITTSFLKTVLNLA